MRKLLAAAALALALPTAAQAVVTYDAFTSFTGASSTAGAFEFGSIDLGNGAAFTLFGPGNCAAYITGTDCRGTLPGVYKTNSGAHISGTVIVPDDALILHPGDGVYGAGTGLFAGIKFNTPHAGNYTVSYSATQSDTSPHTQHVVLLAYIGNTYAGGSIIGTLSASNPTISYSGTGYLPGTFNYVLAIGNGSDGITGDYSNDSTAVNFKFISLVPEPAQWMLMIGGFGLVGGAMRSRRRTAALT